MEEKISYKNLYIFIILGILTGILIGIFKKAIGLVSTFMEEILEKSRGDFKFAILFMLALLIIGFISLILLKSDKDSRGSGIPVMTGMFEGKIKLDSKKTILNKFVASVLTIGSGLTVGREGPSVQLGGLLGDIVSKFDKNFDKKFLIGSAATAGFAVAFNAPLAALVFAIEEVFRAHKKKSFLASAITLVFAILTSNFLFGNLPALVDIPKFTSFNFLDLGLVGILGIITGLSGVLFNFLVIGSKSLYKKIPISEKLKHLFPFIVTGLILLADQRLFASGEELIYLPSLDNLSIKALAYLYIMKIFLLSLAFGAGLSGGSLVPLLAIGAIVGNIYGSGLYLLGKIPLDMVFAYSLIAMAGHFSAIVRTPITAVILIFEMTGGAFINLLPLIIVSLISYIIAWLLKSKPFYEDLYEILLKNEGLEK